MVLKVGLEISYIYMLFLYYHQRLIIYDLKGKIIFLKKLSLK